MSKSWTYFTTHMTMRYQVYIYTCIRACIDMCVNIHLGVPYIRKYTYCYSSKYSYTCSLKPWLYTVQVHISIGPNSYQLFQLIHANIFVNHIYDHYQIFRAYPQNQYLISSDRHIKSLRSHASNVHFLIRIMLTLQSAQGG